MGIRCLPVLAAAGTLATVVAACGGGGGGGGGAGGGSAAPPAPAAAPAAPAAVAVQVSERTGGLASPWSLAFLPDGRALVTERGGTLKLLAASGAVQGNVGGVPPVASSGQGGLLDIVLDPAFAQNRRLYFCFAEADPADPSRNGTALARAVLSADARSLSQLSVIYRQLPKVASVAHFGCRLVFDAGGSLFLTLGERFQREGAQDLASGHGKVVRVTVDGAPAPGNPAWAQAGAQPHTWSYGHRNVQGAALHPSTGELWASEHGPQGGDELNRVLAGPNSGWPLASHGQEYGTTTPVGPTTLAGTEPPAWVWEQADGSAWSGGAKSSIAPSGMAFYTGSAVPQWRDSLFVGALAGTALWRLTLAGNTVTAQERLLADRRQRIRDVEQGPDGALYLLTDDGKLLRYGP